MAIRGPEQWSLEIELQDEKMPDALGCASGL
jgi:hypothetical protein